MLPYELVLLSNHMASRLAENAVINQVDTILDAMREGARRIARLKAEMARREMER